jgi:ankyrin repeat protein
LLLDQKADVNAESDDGSTPLRMAHDKGFSEAAEMLRQHGATQ